MPGLWRTPFPYRRRPMVPQGRGPIAYTLSVGGAVTPAGTLAKATTKPLAGGVTPSGAVGQQVIKVRATAGGMTPTGSIVRAAAKPLAGGLTPAGGLAKVTAKKTAGTLLDPASTNLVSNDSARTNVTGYDGNAGTVTVARTTANFKFGPASIRATYAAAGSGASARYGFGAPYVAVVAGQTYTLSFYPFLVSGSIGSPVPLILWMDAAHGFLSASSGAAYTPGPGWDQRVTLTATAPASAAFCIPYLASTQVAGPLTGVVDFSGVQVEPGTVATSVIATDGAPASRPGVGVLTFLKARLAGGTVTPTGSIQRVSAKPLGGGLTPIGAIAKAVTRALSGGITPTGAILKLGVKNRATGGTVTPTGALGKFISKALGGIIGPSSSLDTVAIRAKRGVRVDVYDPFGTAKLGAGPLHTVERVKYGQRLNRFGAAEVVISANDPQVPLLTGRVQLWIYVGGEGCVHRGRILARSRVMGGKMTLQLSGLEDDLRTKSTGLRRVFTNASITTVWTGLLTATGWAAGVLSGTPALMTRVLYARWIADALGDAAEMFGGFVRFDHVTVTGGVPVQKVDFVSASEDSGIILKTVSVLRPELRENRAILPLQALTEEGSGGAIINHVVMLGAGTGEPMLTLKNATKGAPLGGNLSFESGVAGWAVAGGYSLVQSAGWAKDGIYSALVTWASGTSSCLITSPVWALAGVTTGRKWRIGIFVYAWPAGAMVGKNGFIFAYTLGGSSPVAASSPQTIIAGEQYWEVELAAADANSTGIQFFAGCVDAGGSGQQLAFDRVRCWESTGGIPYPVEQETGPGGIVEYFMEDVASVAKYGELVAYPAVKDVLPTVAGVAAWVASNNSLYDTGAQILALRREEPVWYKVKPLWFQHVSSGIQLLKPGQQVRLLAHVPFTDPGELAARTTFALDTRPTVIGFDREIAGEMDTTELELSSTGLAQMTAAAHLDQVWSEFGGSENEIKQSSFTDSLIAEGLQKYPFVAGDPPTGSAIIVRPPMDGLMLASRMTYVVEALVIGAGGARVDIGIVGPATSNLFVWLALNVDLGAGPQPFDVTSYFQQAPTPVPWPDPAPGIGATTLAVTRAASGPGTINAIIRLTAKTEGVKLPKL